MLTCTKKVWGKKKASTICTETAKKRKSTAAGTQLIGKDSTAGKRRWSEGKEKAKWHWEMMSAQRDGENKAVTIGCLLLSQDTHFRYFSIHSLFHWAGAAQWSSLWATNVPLVQLSDLAWLPSGCFVAMQIRQEDWETTDQTHSVSHQLSYKHSTAVTRAQLQFSLLPSSALHSFCFFHFHQQSPGQLCRLSEVPLLWQDVWEAATHGEVHEMPKCVYVWVMCLSSCASRSTFQAMEPHKGCR